jgi:hypothetical protein
MSFDDQKQGIFISCFCSYIDSILKYNTGAIIGGHGIYQNLSGGSVIFKNTNHLCLCIQERIENIFKTTTLTQNYTMTNKIVYTTEIEKNNPDTIFRVGTFDVEDLNGQIPIAKFYFTSYDENLTRGFGSHIIINDKQVIFSYYLSAYISSILEPNTLVKSVKGCMAGGQNFSKYIQTGIFETHTFPPTLNEKYSYFYKEKEQFNLFQSINILALNRKTTIIPTENVEGTIRLGYYELYNMNNQLIGFLYFSNFITGANFGFGQGVFAFNDNNNLYLAFESNLANPLDPDTKTKITGCLTGGNGKYESITWGETNFTLIPDSESSFEVNIVY